MVSRFILMGIVIVGLALSIICASYTLSDWVALDKAYLAFQRLAADPNSSETAVLAAGFIQQAHRINCFAEGVGVLGGVLISAIGAHGLCFRPRY